MPGAKIDNSYAERACRTCGKVFYCKVYCSRECFRQGRLKELRDKKALPERNCAICGLAYHSNFKQKSTCSLLCSKLFKERLRKAKPPLKDVDPERYARNRLQRKLNKYGITIEAHNALVAKNGYVCAICKDRGKSEEALHIDHCHSSGKVRGLLCKRCNTALGYFDDRAELLREAANYLEHDGPCK